MKHGETQSVFISDVIQWFYDVNNYSVRDENSARERANPGFELLCFNLYFFFR